MDRSVALFADHPVNVARRQAGKSAGDQRLAVGPGQRPSLAPFRELYGRQGAMITAVDLLRGLAALIGWSRIEVPGATGYTDTDYAAKGRYAVDALAATDLVCVHVEATDEASHEGDVGAKCGRWSKSTSTSWLRCTRPCGSTATTGCWCRPTIPRRCGRRPTATGPCRLPVRNRDSTRPAATYDEPSAAASALVFDEGWQLMSFFLG